MIILYIHALKLTYPLKMMVSTRNILFQGLFSGAMLVSGRVAIRRWLGLWKDIFLLMPSRVPEAWWTTTCARNAMSFRNRFALIYSLIHKDTLRFLAKFLPNLPTMWQMNWRERPVISWKVFLTGQTVPIQRCPTRYRAWLVVPIV